MAKNERRYTDLVVYNSITNELNDDKFDVVKPFSFVEFLNYIFTLDDEDIENFKQYKKYIKQWEVTNYKNKKNINFSIRDIYINFFNDLTLYFSNEEERRFFKNINLNDSSALTQAIPFYSKRIKDIITYYRERRSTFKKELREVKNKGSNESIKNHIKNSVIDFFESPNVNISETFNLSSTFIDLDVELEEGYDTFNNYFDVDPSSVRPNETFTTNKINYNATIDFDKALVDVINDNNVLLKELAPFNIKVNFNRVFSDYFRDEDFIDYNKGNNQENNYNIALEAELSKKFTGADYYYLSTNDTSFVSGILFEAEDETSNALNVNFPSFRSNISESTIFERDVGIYFEPTKFSLLRVDGQYDRKVKLDLQPNNVYIFPDPNKYGDILNASTTKRLNPFNFYFKYNSYKNVSSSLGRKIPKSEQRSHYFHSYNTLENKRYNINNDSSIDKGYQNLINYGTLFKNESDIYGNEFISYVDEPRTVRNVRSGVLYNNDERTAFESGNTIDTSLNKYGIVQPKKLSNDRIKARKLIYHNDIVNNKFTILSASPFNNILDKLVFNSSLRSQINDNIFDINIYDDTYSITTSTFNVIDGFAFENKAYKNLASEPFILQKEAGDLTGFSNDYIVDGNLHKVRITPFSLSGYSSQFYYEFYSYDTVNKRPNSIADRINTSFDFFKDNFFFDDAVIFNRIDTTKLSYNSQNKEFILTTTFKDSNNSPIIHLLKYTVYNNSIAIRKNVLYRDKHNLSPSTYTDQLSAQFALSATYSEPVYFPTNPPELQRSISFYTYGN